MIEIAWAEPPDGRKQHSRLNVAGFHIAIQWGAVVRGIAVWPPGAWPKVPWLYRFCGPKGDQPPSPEPPKLAEAIARHAATAPQQ
jgi:hypothetical protein